MDQYLSLIFFCSQRVNPFLQNLIDFVWHFVPKPVHCLGNRIREEAIASKESLNSWLKSFAVHTKLGDKKINNNNFKFEKSRVYATSRTKSRIGTNN